MCSWPILQLHVIVFNELLSKRACNSSYFSITFDYTLIIVYMNKKDVHYPLTPSSPLLIVQNYKTIQIQDQVRKRLKAHLTFPKYIHAVF